MRLETLIEKLAEELHEIAALLWPIKEGRLTLSRKKPSQEYKMRKARVEKLLEQECEGKPESFGVFKDRIDSFFYSFEQLLLSRDDDTSIWSVKSEVSVIVDDLWEVHECLGVGGKDYAAAADHIQSFKDELDLLQAGAAALQKEHERKSEYRLDRVNRSLLWFGELYEGIPRNPFEIIEVLFDAFEKGIGWVSLEYIREKCRGIATLQGCDEKSLGIAEVFTVRVLDDRTRTRIRKKLKIWEIIEVDGRNNPLYRLKVPSTQNPD